MSDTTTTWIENYRKAWLSNDEADIRALFTDDAVYEFRPHDPKPWTGVDAIVSGWLAHPDAPGDTTFEWHPLATEGSTSIVQAVVVYDNRTDRSAYDNLWVITFEPDGRASHFTEWYMERKAD